MRTSAAFDLQKIKLPLQMKELSVDLPGESISLVLAMSIFRSLSLWPRAGKSPNATLETAHSDKFYNSSG